MTKTYHIRIFGRVQGVNYRYAAKQAAESLGITGYVQNKDDGSVFIAASGEENHLNEMVKWCKEGPSMARVEDVKVEEVSFEKYSGFDTY
ncbi:MAG: acylphosphatase [Bacteroidota bacterium]